VKSFLLFVAIAAVAAGMKTRATRLTAGGEAPYRQWKLGPPSDPGYFPIGVWVQDPKNARRYQAAGINLYVGLWQGPTEAQLADLRAAKMPVICAQNRLGLVHKSDPTIIGWMHDDEPDNAQPVVDPVTGSRSYGPPVPPPRIVADYGKLRRADPNRPILLNLGQGVGNDEWVGRGPEGKLSDYPTYVKGCDIVSYDVYPVAGLDRPDGENYLWYVAKGVERLVRWTEGEKPVWNCIECTHVGDAKAKATPHQVRAEVWMSLIHGSRGLIWFVHEFAPKFNEHALLDDPRMLSAVTTINRQIRELAPVLNSPSVLDAVKAESTTAAVPVGTMTKRHGGATYLFAVGMRNGPTTGAFTVRGLPSRASAEVIGENRRLPVRAGRFTDQFKAYDVHLYRIR
jgi:hypothetical protein